MVVNLRFDMGAGIAGCHTAGACVESAVATLAWLVLWVGGSTLLLFASQPNIEAARAVLSTERERVRAERDAFERFGREVRSVVPTAPAGPEPGGILLADGDDGLSEIREAYRETVMAVDHYAEDYDEPLARHLATEFGDDLACAVADGDGVPPGLPDALVARSREARAVRESYLDTLDDEADRLTRGRKALKSLAEDCERLDDRHLRLRPFDDLRERWRRLQSHRQTLDWLLEDHQERVRESVTTGPRVPDPTHFFEYLYRDLDVQFPVLADGLAFRRELDALDHRLTRAIAGRP